MRSAPLRCELGLRVGEQVLRLGGEADDQPRPLRVMADGRRGCRGSRPARSVGGPSPAAFLILSPAALAAAPVGDGGDEDRGVGRQQRLDGRQHLARRLDLRRSSTPAGSGMRHRAGDQRAPRRRAAPAPRRWRGPACPTSGWRCSAPDRSARASGPEVTRMRCARRAAWSPASSSASIAATISSGSAMRPSPASPLSAISPRLGPTKRDAVGAQASRGCAASPDGSTCAGFIAGAISTRLVGGQQHGGGQIVGEPVGELGHAGRRWPARPRSGRPRATAGYGRHRARRRGRTGR